MNFNPTMQRASRILLGLGALASFAAQADVLDDVKANGVVKCGVTLAAPGFSAENNAGKREGFRRMTVLQNLTVGPVHGLGVARGEAHARALHYLERVGLVDQMHKHPAQLSGGQQQRVAIARTLCTRPQVVLFDEPTASLDPEMVGDVLQTMETLAAEGMTMLIVTHEMSFARRVADRAIFMDQGQIVEAAAPDDFFERPQSPRLRSFLARVLPR